MNRNKVKLSYRCLPNVKAHIAKHNAKILNQANQDIAPENCNCNDPSVCPLPEKCTAKNVVYQATIKTDGNHIEKYVGLTAPSFKTRYLNHNSDLRYESRRNSTTMSIHIWNLMEQNKPYQIKYKMLGRATPFSPISGVCNLCTSEKHFIVFKPETNTLNKRKEIFAHCRHKESQLLIKSKS